MSTREGRRRLDPSTVVVVSGRGSSGPGNPVNAPVVFSSIFRPGDEQPEYGRVGNPTWTAFENALGELERGDALAFSSGMAAAAALFDIFPTGTLVVAPSDCYHGIRLLLDEAE